MVIKNRKKIIRVILVIIGIVVFINILTPNKTLSHQEIEYKTVTVTSGDTLWSIAKIEQKSNKYYEGKDIRDIISDIKEINNLESSSLKINQILEVPTY